MMMNRELQEIEERVQEAFQRKQLAWKTYMDTTRRFDSAYYIVVFTREDFYSAMKRLKDGSGTEISVKIAEKRRKSAQEELRYQEMERESAKVEFELAWSEHQRWSEMLWQKRAEMRSDKYYDQNMKIAN